MFKTFIAGAASALLFALAPTSSARTLPQQHQSLPCAACHNEPAPTQAKTINCSSCHGTAADMAKKTAAKYGVRNPHAAPHWPEGLPCEECHRQHKPTMNYCTEACHSFPEMPKVK